MDARLPTSLTVAGLLRLAEAQGGFGMVIANGDERAGSILVVLAERGQPAAIMERVLQSNGAYAWQRDPIAGSAQEANDRIARRRRIDPDLWIIELDVASAERFAAEMKQLD